MRYQKDQLIHGFRVQRAEESQDPKGNIFQMEHERTGARLFFLDNGAENMVFSISFRTLPQDSTGVFHILEHSLLCGSEKYPMKEPFVELLKSSMNTFLNAMTFPDMTMFPVASRNPRDLMNLTGVYLDAVFAPASMKDRKRFCQEGWHIDRDEEGNPEYRGVVYNEMKGAMSETDALIEHELVSMLFPDTYNGYNSGGDPEQITDLTYEEYKRQYERCYHPGNAWIYLDGAVPMEEMLPLLDETFSSYNKRTNHPEFSYQQPKGSERTIFYDRGVLETVKKLRWRSDIIHCHGCITALVPLYIKKTYCDEPSFMDSKIVYSLYGNEFNKSFSESFTQKVMVKGVEKEDLGTIAEPINFIQLSKLAIDHADAVVQQTPDVDPELIAYAKQSGKPFLPYQEDNMLQAISDFYDTI